MNCEQFVLSIHSFWLNFARSFGKIQQYNNITTIKRHEKNYLNDFACLHGFYDIWTKQNDT